MKLIFYDFETTGRDKYWDQIIQVGAILCDENLNELDQFNIKCKLNKSIIPAPQALLVNGLSMSEIATHQLSYYDLVYQMKEKFEDWSPAIFIGYNSINFDEEFLRNALFQNLHENAYLTQINNNGRADALNIVQASSIFTPTAIKIPDTKNKFKLDLLAPLNNIEHENAHDALADVIATIELCKLIKKNDGEFWDQSLQSSTKRGVSEIFEKDTMYCHQEAYYGSVYPFVTTHVGTFNNRNNSEINILFDLKKDPKEYIDLDKAQLKELYKSEKLFRYIRNNKHPIIMPKAYATSFTNYEKIGFDELESRVNIIQNDPDFKRRILEIHHETSEGYSTESQIDVYEEESIYLGGFPSLSDKLTMKKFHSSTWEDRVKICEEFKDKRYTYFGKQIIYNHNIDLLEMNDRNILQKATANRLMSNNSEKWLTIPEAFNQIDNLRDEHGEDADILKFIDEFNTYLEDLYQSHSSGLLTS
ncbi:MAG: exonuclease domain-containing protein [Hyphomicrobiales bacterium]